MAKIRLFEKVLETNWLAVTFWNLFANLQAHSQRRYIWGNLTQSERN